MLQYMRSRVKSFPMLSRIAIVYEVILIRIREVTRFLRALHRAVVLFTPATGRKIQRNCRPSGLRERSRSPARPRPPARPGRSI